MVSGTPKRARKRRGFRCCFCSGGGCACARRTGCGKALDYSPRRSRQPAPRAPSPAVSRRRSGAGVQADGRGGADVERLLAAGLRDAHLQRGTRADARARRPALRGPAPRRRARAARPGAGTRRVRTGGEQRHLQARRAAPARRPRSARSPKCAPMPARSTLGDHSAAVPLSAITWRKPKAAALRRMEPTLPASCRRSSTTVGASAASGRRGGQRRARSPWRAGDSSPLRPANSASSPAPALPARASHCAGVGTDDSANTAMRGVHAARQRRAAQVVALEPDAALLAVGRAVLRQLAQVLEQRVVAPS